MQPIIKNRLSAIDELLKRANMLVGISKIRLYVLHLTFPIIFGVGLGYWLYLLGVSPPRCIVNGWAVLHIGSWYKPCLIVSEAAVLLMTILFSAKGLLRFKNRSGLYLLIDCLNHQRTLLLNNDENTHSTAGEIARPEYSMDAVLEDAERTISEAEGGANTKPLLLEVLLYISLYLGAVSLGLLGDTLFNAFLFSKISILQSYPLVTHIVGAISLLGIAVCIPIAPYFCSVPTGVHTGALLWVIGTAAAPVLLSTAIMLVVAICAGIIFMIYATVVAIIGTAAYIAGIIAVFVIIAVCIMVLFSIFVG